MFSAFISLILCCIILIWFIWQVDLALDFFWLVVLMFRHDFRVLLIVTDFRLVFSVRLSPCTDAISNGNCSEPKVQTYR